MPVMMKHRLGWATAALAVVLGAVLCVGCGQRIEAPRKGKFELNIPPPDSYTFKFERVGFGTASDIELARGGLVYLASTEGVTSYYQDINGGPGYPFAEVIDAAATCEAPSGNIVIADRGDMYVKVYEPDGTNMLASFTDTTWSNFGGVAADDSGNIYVADVDRSFVRAYLPDGGPRFVDEDGFVVDMADSGFGLGHVLSPHGLFYDGESLWIADTGKNWVQEVLPDSIQLGLAYLDGYTYEDVDGNEIKIPFSSPVDVATDDNGFLYVVDRGNQRIFKFDENRASFATVNYDTTMGRAPGLRAIGVNTSMVFAIDDSLESILVWELR